MNAQRKAVAAGQIRQMVEAMREDGVDSSERFGPWKKTHLPELNKWFGFEGFEDVPAINTLFTAQFHPEKPLVMFNYSPVAHNTLHARPEGWTDTLRMCRGIVFDYQSAELVATPYHKFFNQGENPETISCPDGEFEATIKMDGHLGIIFRHQGEMMLTTRGYFTSSTSILGGEMLRHIVTEKHWDRDHLFPDGTTLLVEIIAPETHVLTDYDFTGFVVTGAYNEFRNLAYPELTELAGVLSLPITDVWTGGSIQELAESLLDRQVMNQEGFVACWPDDLRIKFKFESYIGKMVENKLSLGYVMKRLMSGNATRMFNTLPEEVYPRTTGMSANLMLALSTKGTLKEKYQAVYKLLRPSEDTPYARGVCREFVRHFTPVER